MWSCSAPQTSLQSGCMGRPMGTFGTWPGSSVCTPMLVLVRLQRHYIAGCDTFGSLVVLTSGDCLVTVVCSQEAVVTNRYRSTHTNAKGEWPPSKEQAESSSKRHYDTHRPPHTKATPHQGFMKALEPLGPIPSLPLPWNSKGLNCPRLPCCSMHHVLELQ
jgi:hypothetical protein